MSQVMQDLDGDGEPGSCLPEFVVEVRLKQPSAIPRAAIQEAVTRALFSCGSPLELGPVRLEFGLGTEALTAVIDSINVTDMPPDVQPGQMLATPQDVSFRVLVYHLFDEGPSDEVEGDESLATYKEWELPSAEFSGMWEALLYESEVKDQLVRYAVSALHFADLRVDPQLVCWNRVVLLHGPPGTGKTSLCKALAQKLAVRFNERFAQSVLIEVNAHSLFSKWFSESGKLVGKLFEKIGELVDDPDVLVFVLIDEVESLSAARRSTGSEPSDAIRVVNALLTQLDNLKSKPNVMVLTTSNITGAIDVAFVDRADIKAYVGPPGLLARYGILRSCVLELLQKGVVRGSPESAPAVGWKLEEIRSKQQKSESGRVGPAHMSEDQEEMLGKAAAATRALWEAAAAAEGLSGRALRKAPFLAHSTLRSPNSAAGAPLRRFLQALVSAILSETRDRAVMNVQEHAHRQRAQQGAQGNGAPTAVPGSSSSHDGGGRAGGGGQAGEAAGMLGAAAGAAGGGPGGSGKEEHAAGGASGHHQLGVPDADAMIF